MNLQGVQEALKAAEQSVSSVEVGANLGNEAEDIRSPIPDGLDGCIPREL